MSKLHPKQHLFNKKDGTPLTVNNGENSILVFVYDWWHFGTTRTARRFVITFPEKISVEEFMRRFEDAFKDME